MEALGINGGFFIAQLVNFGVIALLLSFLAWRPLTRMLDERAMKIAAAGGGAAEGAAGEIVKAPMPGVVVGIAVAVGDEVEAGQGVVTLEAMKMENELKSASGGTVQEIRVEVGQGVSQGESLVVIE